MLNQNLQRKDQGLCIYNKVPAEYDAHLSLQTYGLGYFARYKIALIGLLSPAQHLPVD